MLLVCRYRLVPNGSHSRLERIDDQAKELPLYGSSGFKLFWESKFDQAMVAFLDCTLAFKASVCRAQFPGGVCFRGACAPFNSRA